MLSLLLDEHVSPKIAQALRRRNTARRALCMAEWENGRFLGTDDELLLREAAVQRLTLVTYDRRTIPPLLKRWAEEGRSHGGVIFVDQRTIPSSDFGGLIRALEKLSSELGSRDWSDSVILLRRAA
jgi:hypothetical protein